jgi:hypothetical protein
MGTTTIRSAGEAGENHPCDLWREPGRRVTAGIVPDGDADFILDPQYVPFDEFLANSYQSMSSSFSSSSSYYAISAPCGCELLSMQEQRSLAYSTS